MKRNFFTRNSIIFLLTLILTFSNFGIVYAYWASSVEGSNNQTTGTIVLGEWVPADFIGVANQATNGMITLNQIGSGTNTLDKNYILMEDINWQNQTFTPIGGASGVFTGSFYGNGKKISNINITANQQYLGLFARNNGIISGVSLENIEITRSSTTEHYAGAIAGENTGEIQYSYTTGKITVTTSYSGNVKGTVRTARAGGIAGINSGLISWSHSSVEVNVTTSVSMTQNGNREGTAISMAGGLVGENTNTGEINFTYSNGIVTANSIAVANGNNSPAYAISYAGGLIGNNNAGIVDKSFATGTVYANVQGKSGNTGYYGGLIGLGSATLSNRLSGQSVTTNLTNVNANGIGTLATLNELRTITGAAAPLAFSTTIWNITSTELPRLKGNKY